MSTVYAKKLETYLLLTRFHCVIFKGTCQTQTLRCAILGQQCSSTSTNVSGKWDEKLKLVFCSPCAWRNMQTLPPKLWRGKRNSGENTFILNFHQSSGWVFSNSIISTVPEVALWCCPSKNNFPPRCDSRNLGLSPLCDLDRNIPMPARYNNAVCWLPVQIDEPDAFSDIVRLSLPSIQNLLLLTWSRPKHPRPWGFLKVSLSTGT